MVKPFNELVPGDIVATVRTNMGLRVRYNVECVWEEDVVFATVLSGVTFERMRPRQARQIIREVVVTFGECQVLADAAIYVLRCQINPQYGAPDVIVIAS